VRGQLVLAPRVLKRFLATIRTHALRDRRTPDGSVLRYLGPCRFQSGGKSPLPLPLLVQLRQAGAGRKHRPRNTAAISNLERDDVLQPYRLHLRRESRQAMRVLVVRFGRHYLQGLASVLCESVQVARQLRAELLAYLLDLLGLGDQSLRTGQ